MKKHHQEVVEPLSRLSGLPWTPEKGLDFNQNTPPSLRAVWHTYIAVRALFL